MKRVKSAFAKATNATGLSERTIIWSVIAVIFMVLFSVLFTYPIAVKTRMIEEENSALEAKIKEQELLSTLDEKLSQIMRETYSGLRKTKPAPLKEENLLELPAYFDKIASQANSTLISLTPKSVNDGEMVEINAIFQGQAEDLFKLLQKIGQVEYVKRLESINILALADSEQMELILKVPVE